MERLGKRGKAHLVAGTAERVGPRWLSGIRNASVLRESTVPGKRLQATTYAKSYLCTILTYPVLPHRSQNQDRGKLLYPKLLLEILEPATHPRFPCCLNKHRRAPGAWKLAIEILAVWGLSGAVIVIDEPGPVEGQAFLRCSTVCRCMWILPGAEKQYASRRPGAGLACLFWYFFFISHQGNHGVRPSKRPGLAAQTIGLQVFCCSVNNISLDTTGKHWRIHRSCPGVSLPEARLPVWISRLALQ
ncbi:hypothetical protein L1887_47938 [Cichorium endivia]|nr:hypothetical protein L1887_47938 [Cichorium endivia]